MIITAKYLGPTNTKGARIKVSVLSKSGAKYYPWDYSTNPGENYKRAFKSYLAGQVYLGGLIWVMDCTDTGMIATNSGTSFTL
jgi:hypothetical protein